MGARWCGRGYRVKSEITAFSEQALNICPRTIGHQPKPGSRGLSPPLSCPISPGNNRVQPTPGHLQQQRHRAEGAQGESRSTAPKLDQELGKGETNVEVEIEGGLARRKALGKVVDEFGTRFRVKQIQGALRGGEEGAAEWFGMGQGMQARGEADERHRTGTAHAISSSRTPGMRERIPGG